MKSKKMILCLAMISLLLTSCAQAVNTDPDTVNIMCTDYQSEVIHKMFANTSREDTSLVEPHYITEKNYASAQEWSDALHKSLLTNNPDIDIYCLDSLDEYAYKIIQDHYYVNLSTDDVLAEKFGAMYPEIKTWCSRGDELFGFPYSVEWFLMFMVDETQTGSIGYDRDEFETVDDLIDFCDAWTAKSAVPPTEGFNNIFWYLDNYLFIHYDRNTRELNLDNPQFRKLISQCRELSQPDALFALHDSTYSAHTTFTSPVQWSMLEATMQLHSQFTPVPYPQLAGENVDGKRFARVTWMIINPYSIKTEDALGCIRNMTGWAWNVDIHRTPIYREVESYPNGWYKQEQLDTAGALLKKMDVGFRFPGYGEVMSACSGYIRGSKTLDETISESQRVLDTARKEQHIGED